MQTLRKSVCSLLSTKSNVFCTTLKPSVKLYWCFLSPQKLLSFKIEYSWKYFPKIFSYNCLYLESTLFSGNLFYIVLAYLQPDFSVIGTFSIQMVSCLSSFSLNTVSFLELCSNVFIHPWQVTSWVNCGLFDSAPHLPLLQKLSDCGMNQHILQ